MKKFTLVVCLLIIGGMAGYAAPAGPVGFVASGFCVPFPVYFADGAGTQTATCPSFSSIVGFTIPTYWIINSITLEDLGTFLTTVSFGTTTSYVITATPGSPTGFSYAWSSAFVVNTGEGSIGAQQVSNNPQWSDVQFFGYPVSANLSFVVTMTAATTAGFAATLVDVKSVSYDYTIIAGTPEPSVLSLIGFGLVGLGIFGSKLSKRK